MEPIAAALEEFFPQPYAGEIRGVATGFGLSIGDVVLLNFAYETTAYVYRLRKELVFFHCFDIRIHGVVCTEGTAEVLSNLQLVKGLHFN